MFIMILVQFTLILLIKCVIASKNCLNINTTITQKIENEGFHRNINWLVELHSLDFTKWKSANCNLVLQYDVSAGMYVDPDEISDWNRLRKICAYVKGGVNIEAPLHESTEHAVFIFIPNLDESNKATVTLPVHLRYQRAQITGGNGKISLYKPYLLLNCSEEIGVCQKNSLTLAPCDVNAANNCTWKNITYDALFEELELFVPIGNLDDYPLVSIVTLILGCFACFYVLSIISSSSR